MFVLQKPVAVDAFAALSGAVGYFGQTAIDQSNGDIYAKLAGGWTKIADTNGNAVAVPVNGSVTVQNSSGSITRTLTATAGLATLAATDTIVANGDTALLQTSAGTTSTTTATLNSPATATVAAGALTAVKASA